MIVPKSFFQVSYLQWYNVIRFDKKITRRFILTRCEAISSEELQYQISNWYMVGKSKHKKIY